ncbi:hypothetical protein F4703DRAFT_1793304 [Phycomyces blakesleeanus]
MAYTFVDNSSKNKPTRATYARMFLLRILYRTKKAPTPKLVLGFFLLILLPWMNPRIGLQLIGQRKREDCFILGIGVCNTLVDKLMLGTETLHKIQFIIWSVVIEYKYSLKTDLIIQNRSACPNSQYLSNLERIPEPSTIGFMTPIVFNNDFHSASKVSRALRK